MAYIKTISPLMAKGRTREVYKLSDKLTGIPMAGNIIRLFSLRSESMQRFIRNWELNMWIGDEPRATRELIASAVSRYNDCHY